MRENDAEFANSVAEVLCPGAGSGAHPFARAASVVGTPRTQEWHPWPSNLLIVIAPIATRPLILLPRRSQMSERLHSSTILARIVLQSAVSLSPGDKFSSGS